MPRFRAAGVLCVLLTVVGGGSLFGGVLFGIRCNLQQQVGCQETCFPFVFRVVDSTCECADLGGEFHPEGW